MAQGLLYAHSGWRYIVLLVLVIAIVKMVLGWLGKGTWSKLDQQLGMITPIVIDVQWLLGIVLWLMAPAAWFVARNASFAEHIGTMTLALIAGHIGWSRAKRATVAVDHFRNDAIGFIIAGLLVGLSVARITGVM